MQIHEVPHKCPVCDGSGQYKEKQCHGCAGSGIVFGKITISPPESKPFTNNQKWMKAKDYTPSCNCPHPTEYYDYYQKKYYVFD